MKEFLDRVQGYYGPYNNIQGREIVRYLAKYERSYTNWLDILYDEVLKNYSSRWKLPPDIAVFEEVKELVKGRMPNRRSLPSPDENDGDLATPEEVAEFMKNLKWKLSRKKSKSDREGRQMRNVLAEGRSHE